MIKTILVPSIGRDTDNAVFASALAVARPFAAHLDVLHVRVDAAAMAVTMAAEAGGATMVGGPTHAHNNRVFVFINTNTETKK